MIRTILCTLWLALPLMSFSEIYQWKDANGKIHYSDKPPENSAGSKDISDQLRPLNSDSSTSETGKLKQVFAGETPEEKNYRLQQQAKQQQQEANRQQACQQARNQLSVLRGRVAFIDKEGKEVIVTEEERQQRADKLALEIDKYCS